MPHILPPWFADGIPITLNKTKLIGWYCPDVRVAYGLGVPSYQWAYEYKKRLGK